MVERRSAKEAQVAMAKASRSVGGEMVSVSKRRRKQPYKRNVTLEQTFLTRLACGESMIDICNDPKMPSRVTIHNWMTADPEFEAMVDDAYKWKARYFGEAILDVAEGGLLSTGDIRRDELKIKALTWLASKYDRTRFGENVRLDVKHSAVTVEMPMEWLEAETIPVKRLTGSDDAS